MPELIEAVVSLLSMNDLLRTRGVNHQWQELVMRSPSCRKTLFLTPVNTMTTWTIRRQSDAKGRHANILDIEETHQRYDLKASTEFAINRGRMSDPSPVIAVMANPRLIGQGTRRRGDSSSRTDCTAWHMVHRLLPKYFATANKIHLGSIVPPTGTVWGEMILTQPPCSDVGAFVKVTLLGAPYGVAGGNDRARATATLMDRNDEVSILDDEQWTLDRIIGIRQKSGIKLKHVLNAALKGVDAGELIGLKLKLIFVAAVERTEAK